LPPVRMAVNVSARQFRTELFKMVSGTLSETGLDPHWLELEVTEGLLMEEPEAASAVLSELKALGVYIAIDDFGAGYSSLTYLKHFPIDMLKIDRSFIRDLSTDPDDAAIAKAIIALAHSLDLKVVAEGVETPEQRAFLLQHGCDMVQGHYYSVPMKAAELVPVLRQGSIPRV
jgi:EAL domain-containing protein (putative c-di-GMP-specific phosphodiesterase class I)